jgi:tRNA threonylcarbamoyladenosine biosynthesis protein TsaB
MLTLALDTSTRFCSMALLRGHEVMAKIAGVTDEPYASRVFNDLQELLQQTGIRLSDIELFAVVGGPGSFTGLRVGLTAVKGWAEVFRRPVAVVSALHAVAAQSAGKGPLAAIIDARAGQLFCGFYRKNLKLDDLTPLGEEVVLAVADFDGWIRSQANGEQVRLVTPGLAQLEPLVNLLSAERREWEGVSSELAPVVGLLGQHLAEKGELVDALTLEANYLRKSDAEMKWKVG